MRLRFIVIISAIFFYASNYVPALGQQNIHSELNLKLLSTDQIKAVRTMMIYMAIFDARLENCGTRLDFEKRVTSSIKACITSESLNWLVREFRFRKKDAFDYIARDEKKGPSRLIYCSSPTEKKWLKNLIPLMEDQIVSLARMCRSCNICRT
jgi:hypothetical protein